MPRIFKKLFLPGGMILAVVLSFVWPDAGIAVRKLGWNNALIVLIFFICGLQTNLKELAFNRRFLALMVGGGVVALVFSPLLAAGAARLLGFGTLAAAGFVVMAAVPPTLSSGVVMTETAGGNLLLSLAVTIGYNLAGVLVMPLMLTLCLAGGGGIQTDPMRMFRDLALLVVLPFVAGLLIRRFSGWKPGAWSSYVTSLCVIVLVLSFFSSSSAMIRSFSSATLLWIGGAALVLHLGLMALMWGGAAMLKAPVSDRKAMVFSGASKTVTIALATLAFLGADDGEAVIPCLIFYFIQMMVDSAVAGRMGLTEAK